MAEAPAALSTTLLQEHTSLSIDAVQMAAANAASRPDGPLSGEAATPDPQLCGVYLRQPTAGPTIIECHCCSHHCCRRPLNRHHRRAERAPRRRPTATERLVSVSELYTNTWSAGFSSHKYFVVIPSFINIYE